MSNYEDYATGKFQNYTFMEKVGNAWKIKNTDAWKFVVDTSTEGPIVYRMRRITSHAPAEISEIEQMVHLLGTGNTQNQYEAALIESIRADLLAQWKDLTNNAVKRIYVLQEENARLQNLCTSRRIVIEDLQRIKKTLKRVCLILFLIIAATSVIGWLQIFH